MESRRAAAGRSIEQDALNVPKGYLSRYTRTGRPAATLPGVHARAKQAAHRCVMQWRAMRGHIKPVMVPFSRAITRPRCYLASYRFRDPSPTLRAVSSARTFLSPDGAGRRIVSLFPHFHIAPHCCTARDPRGRYAILRNSPI